MTTLSIVEAQARLPELIQGLQPGDEILITENDTPVARLTGQTASSARRQRPGPGLCRGMISSMAPDFDAPLDDLKEYME